MDNSRNVTHERLYLSGAPGRRQSKEDFLAAFDVGRIPPDPGCYMMVDAKGKPIYVGKAKNLRARIRNYINESDSRYSVKFLMRRVAHIEFLVTRTEKEALLLENSLIKEHKPRYNVRLKDDKTYLSIRIDPREDWPRLTAVRRYKRDGARYFGPYHDTSAVRRTLRQFQRMFPLRTCSDHVLHNRTRPCLYYQMNQCAAPCVGYVSREAYHEIVQQVILILEGRTEEVEKRLQAQIQAHAEKLEFEEAVELRDRLYDLRRTVERQGAVTTRGAGDRDVFGTYTEGAYTEVHGLFYRGGKLLGGRSFSFEQREMPLEELLSSLLMQYYAAAPVIPAEILVPLPLEEAGALAEVLTEQRGARVVIHHPQRGEKKQMVEMAARNAKRGFQEKQMSEKANRDLLERVQAAFHLDRLPERIECFDISTLQGTKSAGSMVTFAYGEPDKSRYRRFSIKTVEEQDDFASMREVLMRRYTKAIDENDLPDLVLIDGGKGQLNVATAVFQDLGIEDLPRIGIAKARPEDGGHSPERFFLPGRMNPVVLKQSGVVVQYLARIRDEAHRFAVTYHRKRRGRSTISTTLTSIPGVGPKRARTLLNKLGSVARIREAGVDEIAALPGFNETLAEAVHQHLHQQ